MIAEVIVDISSGEVDRIFDYALDESIGASKGYRVEVPFGKRDIEGYVIGIKEKSLLPSDKVKPVKRRLDDYPVISEEMFAVAII